MHLCQHPFFERRGNGKCAAIKLLQRRHFSERRRAGVAILLAVGASSSDDACSVACGHQLQQRRSCIQHIPVALVKFKCCACVLPMPVWHIDGGFGLRSFHGPLGEETTVKKFLSEFKEFINRGNVMDLAVAVIIGGFGPLLFY